MNIVCFKVFLVLLILLINNWKELWKVVSWYNILKKKIIHAILKFEIYNFHMIYLINFLLTPQ